MKTRKFRYFSADFETTVYSGQKTTEVWAAACVELFSEEVKIFHSISEQLEYFISLESNLIVYYHNLKFDGTFWLSYLLAVEEWKQAIVNENSERIEDISFLKVKDMKNRTLSYSISNNGQWYRIILKINDHIIEFRDSLKLLPFSLKAIGENFKTKHKKLEMEYVGIRYAGCPISDMEKQYIANDVLVLKEALEIVFTEGNKKLTIGACCLAEYKNIMGYKAFSEYFPNIYEIPIDENIYGVKNAGDYVKRSYRGGWCYLVEEKANKVFNNGITLDVNSLYPSMMSSESLNLYPVGEPHFWAGNYIPDEALRDDTYYFIRIKTRFYLRNNFLPHIQIKSSLLYGFTEMLRSSDIYNPMDDKFYDYYKDLNGEIKPAMPVLTLTQTDFELIKEHYYLIDLKILDGCYFAAATGIFDDYIDKYKKIKIESTGARRELAKLFLNSLYGKMSASKNSSFKVAYIKEDRSIGFYSVPAFDKTPGYIPVGSAITSYARNFTIRAAQKNYYGCNKSGFIYADTDSIHCDIHIDDVKGIKTHISDFCCWKCESQWDEGIFVRQKSYIEHIISENFKALEKPYYSIKCAGMPAKCKELLKASLEGVILEGEWSDEEMGFMRYKRELTDFKVGLCVPGKLLPRRIPGGVVLCDTTYEMR